MNRLPPHDVLYGGNVPQGISTDPLIINVCLSGNVVNKQVNAYVPCSTGEIIESALRVIEAGASILHVHANDDNGDPTWRPEAFARIFESIRAEAKDVVLVATTSGRLHGDFEKRAAVLDLDGSAKPDMASLTLGSLNFPKQASVNAPATVQQLCRRMHDRGITPELEAFDMGMLNYAFYLQRKGFLPLNCYINLLLGSLGSVPGRMIDLAHMVQEIPVEWTWAAAGIGRYQLPINSAAIIMGGHVRVGLEDNPIFDYNSYAPATNEALVKRLVRIATELGRPIAQPDATRRRLRLGDSRNWSATRIEIRKMQETDRAAAMAILGAWNMAPTQATVGTPNPERSQLDVATSFVATLEGKLVGICSYIVLDETHAETASLAVDPEFLGCGIGYRLHEARVEEMQGRGIRSLRTESDRPPVIHWYINQFGYRVVGKNPKKHDFGWSGADAWTILEVELD
jgi:3-keto-5-aminohexanoate cleavage enzyme